MNSDCRVSCSVLGTECMAVWVLDNCSADLYPIQSSKKLAFTTIALESHRLDC